MTERSQSWVRLPSKWIQEGNLKSLRWASGVGSSNVAALLVLIAIAQHAEQEQGLAFLTYDVLMRATHLSRAMVSAGLRMLEALELIECEVSGKRSW